MDIPLLITDLGMKLNPKTKHRHRYGLFKCECGKQFESIMTLKFKSINKSCGCLPLKCLIERSTIHGMCKTGIYYSWGDMMMRCYNKNNSRYYRYGARGITVCDKWKKFKGFYDDMGSSWEKGLTIERVNVDGNYEPSNCKWITKAEQNRNSSQVRYIEFNGIKKPLFEWAEDIGVSSSVIRARIDKLNWSIEKALTTPLIFNYVKHSKT